MEKESYNIDDILSEVKKRREENELSLKSSDSVKKEEKDESVKEFVLNDTGLAEKEEKPQEPDLKLKNETGSENIQDSELVLEEKQGAEAASLEQADEQEEAADKEEYVSEAVVDNQLKKAEDKADDGMVDLLSLAEKPIIEPQPEPEQSKGKKKE